MPRKPKKPISNEVAEYRQKRKVARASNERHVLVLEADLTEEEKRRIFILSNRLRHLTNILVGTMSKRLNRMTHTRKYHTLRKQYGKLLKGLSAVKDQSSPRHEKLKSELTDCVHQMQAMCVEFGVTFDKLVDDEKRAYKTLDIPSVFALSRAEDIWHGVEKVLFSDGKKLNLMKCGELPEIRAKQPTKAIVINIKGEDLVFSMKGFTPFKCIIKSNNQFAQREYDEIIKFMKNPSVEEEYVDAFFKTGKKQNTFRPCYVALNCKVIRGKLRVYVHITVEGAPLPKLNKDGTPKHKLGHGRVGVDLGSQSIAVVSEDKVMLCNLAERDGKSTKASEAKEKELQRYMARSLRATNPERFNENGTIKEDVHGKWKKSKGYRKAEAKLKEIQRKNKENRKFASNELANIIRELGDCLVIERSNARQMQVKAKRKIVDGKDHRRKRFGKSILNRCPGYMFAVLKRKFERTGSFNVVARDFRASQYCHFNDTYEKKPLSQRENGFENGIVVQRDLYSAFLLFCSNDSFTAPDRERCIKYFDTFFANHNRLVFNIIVSGKEICNSGISVETYQNSLPDSLAA